MEFVIKPYVGVGAVKFGMTRSEVRNLIDGKVQEFRKATSSEVLTDAFVDEGVHVYYDADDTCEALEFALPAKPVLEDISLVNVPFKFAKEHIENMNGQSDLDETGLISFNLGIGLYVPELDKRGESLVESVIVFRKGYYD